MITVIHGEHVAKIPVAYGHVQTVLSPTLNGTRVLVAIEEVNRGCVRRLEPSERAQVAYILEGNDANFVFTSYDGVAVQQTAGRRMGVYLEPGEEASIFAA